MGSYKRPSLGSLGNLSHELNTMNASNRANYSIFSSTRLTGQKPISSSLSTSSSYSTINVPPSSITTSKTKSFTPSNSASLKSSASVSALNQAGT